jgi:hypothetical protein
LPEALKKFQVVRSERYASTASRKLFEGMGTLLFYTHQLHIEQALFVQGKKNHNAFGAVACIMR